MHVVRCAEAPHYRSPGHVEMAMQRLQGLEAGPSESLWIGLLTISPGGGTTAAASGMEKFYVCIQGEVSVEAEASGMTERARLAPLDSCRIAPRESRRLSNPGNEPARLLLVMQLAQASAGSGTATSDRTKER